MNNFFSNLIQSKLQVFASLVVLGFLCYFSVIKGPFFFDDEQFIQKNEHVLNLDVYKIYTNSVTEGAKIKSNFYRPNQQLTFALLHKAFGLNPIPFHLTSILLHITNAFLLFILLIVLLNNNALACVGSVIFLIHPVQTEAVAYISGLADVLGTLFLLSGLLTLIKYWKSNNIKHLLFSCVLFLASLFSKESMVIIAPLSILLALYILFSEKKQIKKLHLISLGIITTLCFIYLYLKFTVFNFSETSIGLTKEINVYTESIYIRLLTFISIINEYIKMYLFPFQLYYGKPYTAYDSFTAKAFFGLIVLSILIFSLIKIKKYPKFTLGISWFFAALMPFTGIIPLNSMFLEHWIYVPSIGLIIITLLFIDWIFKNKSKFILNFIGIILLTTLIYKSNRRASDWADIEKFYLNEIKYNKNVSNFNNLGMYYSDKGNSQKAIYYYQQSISTYDAFAQPHYNLANIYIQTKEYDKVENELYQALMIDPNFYQALNTMQSLYENFNKKTQADALTQLLERVKNGGIVQQQEISIICRGK